MSSNFSLLYPTFTCSCRIYWMKNTGLFIPSISYSRTTYCAHCSFVLLFSHFLISVLALSLLVFFSYLYVSFFCSEIESGENRFSPCQYWNQKKDWKFDLQKNIGNMGCSFLLHPVLENELCRQIRFRASENRFTLKKYIVRVYWNIFLSFFEPRAND